jgi:hypothetical protein
MRKPVIVDVQHSSAWETAKKMGVSRKRTLEIIKMVDEIHDRRDRERKAARAAARKKRLKTA